MVLAINGSNKASVAGAPSGQVAVTTTKGGDILVLLVSTVNAPLNGNPTSVPALIWQNRSIKTNGVAARLETWWAAAPLIGTYTITVNFTGSQKAQLTAFGVSGADMVNPWDTSAGLPTIQAASGSTPTVTLVTLLSANDLALGTYAEAAQASTLTAGVGFNVVQSGGTTTGVADASGGAEQKIAGGTSNVAVGGTLSVSAAYIWVGDAVQAEAAPQELFPSLLSMLGVGIVLGAHIGLRGRVPLRILRAIAAAKQGNRDRAVLRSPCPDWSSRKSPG